MATEVERGYAKGYAVQSMEMVLEVREESKGQRERHQVQEDVRREAEVVVKVNEAFTK